MRVAHLLILLLLALPLSAQERKEDDRMLFAASAAVVSTAVALDLASTILLLEVCDVCQETSLIGPAMNAGHIPSIAVTATLTAGVLLLTNELRKRDESGKHFWLALPVLLTLGHVLAAQQNLGHAFGPYSSLR